MKFHPASTVFALPVLFALVVAPTARGQQDSASAPSAAQGNKAARPPVEQAASQSDVATKKPAKAGAQSGPQSADAAAAKGDKAGKPPVAEAASRAGVATKKPAKRGTQSGPSPASAPER